MKMEKQNLYQNNMKLKKLKLHWIKYNNNMIQEI